MKEQSFFNRGFALWIIFCLPLFACGNEGRLTVAEVSVSQIGSSFFIDSIQSKKQYDLNNPIKCLLPSELMEISGLTIDAKSGNIFTINDEKAIIYEMEDCKIKSENKFGKNGDYEGIELAGGQIFALKSNGKLIQFDTNSKNKIRVINNPLTLSNDTEGLAFHKEKGLLLIACKGSPNIKSHEKLKKTKAVYAYNIIQDEFIEEPHLVVKDDDIKSFFKSKIEKSWSKKEAKKRLLRMLDFSPSGIALNPIDKNYYLISSVGKSMIVLNENNEILKLLYLDHDAYIQPEGLCFDAHGNMYISNEGKGLQSNILKISY